MPMVDTKTEMLRIAGDHVNFVLDRILEQQRGHPATQMTIQLADSVELMVAREEWKRAVEAFKSAETVGLHAEVTSEEWKRRRAEADALLASDQIPDFSTIAVHLKEAREREDKMLGLYYVPQDVAVGTHAILAAVMGPDARNRSILDMAKIMGIELSVLRLKDASQILKEDVQVTRVNLNDFKDTGDINFGEILNDLPEEKRGEFAELVVGLRDKPLPEGEEHDPATCPGCIIKAFLKENIKPKPSLREQMTERAEKRAAALHQPVDGILLANTLADILDGK